MSNQTNGTPKQSDTTDVEATHGVNGATNGHAGFARPADPDDLLSVTESLGDKQVLITGSTGFLGKVVVSMLLRFHPDIEQLYLLIRSRSDKTSKQRFLDHVAGGQALAPIKEAMGDGYADFLDDKVTVVDGDLCRPHLGLPEEQARTVSENLDLFINSAGLTNFNPNLESALQINTLSNEHVLDFIRLGDCSARLLHTSTSFVCGKQSGDIPEIPPGPDVYPRADELQTEYDHRKEIRDCLQLIDHFEEMSHDQEHQVRFRNKARQKLEQQNLDPNDEAAFDEAREAARKKWIKRRLSDEGRQRAEFWGWPNIYTYTKSLGERILTEADDVDVAIVRPAVIESAVEYPETSWNEGINTTAPLAFLIYKGHRFVPTRREVDLDIIPVDHVAGAMLGVGAALIDGTHDDIYHLGSSDLNPVSVVRLAELCALGTRRLVDREVGTGGVQKLLLKSLDSVPVTKEKFDRQSAPGLKRAAGGLKKMLGNLPTGSLGGVGNAIEGVRKGLTNVEKMTSTTEKLFELFLPFIHNNAPTFKTGNIKRLDERLHPGERNRYGCPIEHLDWRHYWIEVHLPGLVKHAFPALEAKLAASQREAYTYDDLVELFDASTHNFDDQIAMQHHDGQIVERYTYGELQEHAERAATTLEGMGMGNGRTALLVSENRPQWGMTYFGILKTGGIAVPVDADATVDQLINVTRTARARLVLVSDAVAERLDGELEKRLAAEELPAQIVTLDQLFRLGLPDEAAVDVEAVEPAYDVDEQPDASDEIVAELLAADDDDEPIASLIFTSGTTGEPKGVQLSHNNFTSLLSNLQRTFDIGEDDGFLSVLPLHHTFEFACGFLMPLSRGATITYLEELSPEELNRALNSTNVTALIGVPALWQLLHRRIREGLDEAPPAAQKVFSGLTQLNSTLRDKFGVNVGPALFGPIHNAFGGNLEYMISGGAALPEPTMKAFHGLGFDLSEGYGLTEAAPVLTVNNADTGLEPGTVGTALPDIEVDIHNPGDDGVGEIIARGPNVMRGYLGRDEATEEALQDGWLHTGDLGKFDDDGNLVIVGREKDVIVTSSGKNVYPDDLEDLYGECPGIDELSIVGLPDGSGSERVACLVRPDVDETDSPEDVAETRADIREWIRVQGSRGPSHRRIQTLRFWDEEFPKTATRKIKRNEVVDILQRLLDAEMDAIERGDVDQTSSDWLTDTLARLADYDPERIHDETHLLDDLGFDSLMFVELASILETRDLHLAPETLADVPTVGQLQRLVDGDDSSTAMIKSPDSSLQQQEAIDVPETVQNAVKDILLNGQMAAYDHLFDVDVYGRAHIPLHNPNIIVVANHCSHLDMGLVKFALGDYGSEIRALAAADYFFQENPRKSYFENFTNLIPVERSGTLESALGEASKALRRGEMLLVFPEGTRSKTGEIQRFRRGLGYLVDTHDVDVLPLWIGGTYDALPKGQALPSPTQRDLNVHIGPLLSSGELKEDVAGEDPTDRYEAISNAARQAVTGLRDAALGLDEDPPEDEEPLEPLFEYLNGRFAENQVDSPVSFYFSLGNWDSHKWTITIDPDACQIENCKPDGRADCVIKTSPEMFRKIVEEQYVPSMDEFVSGDIKTNDPDLLMRFQSAFELT